MKETHHVRATSLKSGLCFYELATWDADKAKARYEELRENEGKDNGVSLEHPAGVRIEWWKDTEEGTHLLQAFAHLGPWNG